MSFVRVFSVKGFRAGLPETARSTAQRSRQGSQTAAGRQRAWRAQTLTARTPWYVEGNSKPAPTVARYSKRSAQASAMEAEGGETPTVARCAARQRAPASAGGRTELRSLKISKPLPCKTTDA